MKKEFKSVANYFTAARIPLAIALFFITPFSLPFYIVYLLCGATDAVDGKIARMTGSASKVGATLDTVADMVMIFSILTIIIINVKPKASLLWCVGAVLFIKLISVIVSFVKFKKLGLLHTYANKSVGVVVFFLPFAVRLMKFDLAVYILTGLFVVSSLEELIINIRIKQYNPDIRSLFFLNKDGSQTEKANETHIIY